MRPLVRLEGAVAETGPDTVALEALTRRVADLEGRLNTMKIIVGLVLAGKLVIVLLFLYLLFAGPFVVRSGHLVRPAVRSAALRSVAGRPAVWPASRRAAVLREFPPRLC